MHSEPTHQVTVATEAPVSTSPAPDTSEAHAPVELRRQEQVATRATPDQATSHDSTSQADDEAPTQPLADDHNSAITSITKTNTQIIVDESTDRGHHPWRPLRQLWWSWTVAGLAIAAYLLTVCYAFGNTSLRYLSFASLSPTRTLLVLRVLSEVAGLLAGSLVYLCSDRALWMLIARKRGAKLGAFLALTSASGPWTWINLVCRNIRGGRSLTWVRVVAAVVVPVMSVVVLSQVSVQQRFDEALAFPIAGGIGDFDVGFVDEWSLIAATYMASDFSSLLQTREIAWPVSVHRPGTVTCEATEAFGGKACGQGYFVHGGIKMITPWPTENTSTPAASIYTARSLRGLHLDFTVLEPGARFQGNLDCIILGDNDLAIQICISQFAGNSLSAKYVQCPTMLRGECLEDRSWTSSSGWTTQLTAYTRQATVHFSRSNLSAVALSDLTTPIPHDLNADGMLSVFNTTLTATTGLGAIVSAAAQFVGFVASFLTLSETSSPTAAQASTRLHNLLAVPLYYFQPTFMSPYTRVPSPNRVLEGLPDGQGLYATAALSTSYFGLAVAPWTVWTYTVAMGLLLLACIVVLVLGSLPSCACGIPEAGPWGFLDLVEKCDVVAAVADTKGETVHPNQRSGELRQAWCGDGWRHGNSYLPNGRVRLRGTSGT